MSDNSQNDRPGGNPESQFGASAPLPAVAPNVQGQGMLSSASPTAPMARSQDDAANVLEILHAFRRRWLVGSIVGVILALVTAGVLWFFIPVNFESVSLVFVDREPPDVLKDRKQAVSKQAFDTFIATQMGAMKTPLVLRRALDTKVPVDASTYKHIKERDQLIEKDGKINIAVSDLDLLQYYAGANSEAWLTRQLSVTNPEHSEIIQVGLKGYDGKELNMIINAVVNAYMKEVVDSEKILSKESLEILTAEYNTTERKIKQLNRDIKQTAEQNLIYGDSRQAEVQLRLNMENLTMISRQVQSTMAQLQGLRAQEATAVSALAQIEQIKMAPEEIESALMQMPQYLEMYMAYSQLQKEIQDLRSAGRGGSARQASQKMGQLQQLQGDLERMRQEHGPRLRVMILKSKGVDPSMFELNLLSIQSQIAALDNLLKQQEASRQEQEDKVRDMGGTSAELENMKFELENAKEKAAQLLQEMDLRQLQARVSQRIRIFQDAMVPPTNAGLFKIIQVVVGSILVFGLCLSGFTFFDYIGGRVNTTEDISKKAAIPVLGSLPMVHGGMLSGITRNRDEMEMAMCDSIDSVRTTLLYSSNTAKPPKLFMVTSAIGLEGKSMVASQLAASLARSGRRTLLVDADIRNPSQHETFQLAFGNGFADVLRGGLAIDDAAQASSIENLYVISAGISDSQSFRSMTNETLGKVIGQMAQQYDAVVFDTGPVLVGSDPLLIGQYCDAAVLSVRRDISRTSKVSQACQRLRSIRIPVAGTIINGTGYEKRHLAALPMESYQSSGDSFVTPEPEQTFNPETETPQWRDPDSQ